MTSESELAGAKFEAYLTMVEASGASQQGDTPPVEYIRSLLSAWEIDHVETVAKNHAESNPAAEGLPFGK